MARSVVLPAKEQTIAPKPVQPQRSTSLPHPKQKVKINIPAMAKVKARRIHHETATEVTARKKREAARRAVKAAEMQKFAKEKQLIAAGKRAAARAEKRRTQVLHRIKHQILARHAGPRTVHKPARLIAKEPQKGVSPRRASGWTRSAGWR
jgi:hypothetical protein